VIRIGTGQRGDRYRYQLAGTPNSAEHGRGTESVADPTETPEPHFGWKA
jgi:hypothetical protein